LLFTWVPRITAIGHLRTGCAHRVIATGYSD
jgi:hypothetical protein